MTADEQVNEWNAQLRAVLRGDPTSAPEEPEKPAPAAPSFHGGPRQTALVEPDPSAVMNAEIRRAAAGLPPERRPEPGSGHRR